MRAVAALLLGQTHKRTKHAMHSTDWLNRVKEGLFPTRNIAPAGNLRQETYARDICSKGLYEQKQKKRWNACSCCRMGFRECSMHESFATKTETHTDTLSMDGTYMLYTGALSPAKTLHQP